MSDKAWDKLNPLDILIRQTARCGMTDGTVMKIEFISGFEKFNTRPYHNYESWGQGYRVTGLGIQVEREDLDDAIRFWSQCVTTLRDGGTVPKWVTHLVESTGLLTDWIKPNTASWNDVVPVATKA